MSRFFRKIRTFFTNLTKPSVSRWSVIALVFSILSIVAYFCARGARHPLLTTVTVILAVIALFMPAFARYKRMRAVRKLGIKRDKRWKFVEIAAIVIAGFSFYCIVRFVLGIMPSIGYLGWVVSAAAYDSIKRMRFKRHKHHDTAEDSREHHHSGDDSHEHHHTGE